MSFFVRCKEILQPWVYFLLLAILVSSGLENFGRISSAFAGSQLDIQEAFRYIIESTRISSRFGYREDPNTGERKHHGGLDLAATEGTFVHAAEEGTVSFIKEYEYGYGKLIIIKHDLGFETRYAHLSEILVVKGEVVEKGKHIGSVGKSGNATGPHLHFEVRDEGVNMDPLDYVDDGKFSLWEVEEEVE